jgi:uncharacterized tellurite resistance protein B-like protein
MLPIYNLFETDEDHRNLSYFAAIVSVVASDGVFDEVNKNALSGLADKLNISENYYSEIFKNPTKFELKPLDSQKDRLVFLFDLFKLIYNNHKIDDTEIDLLHAYSIGLGFSPLMASKVILKSIETFEDENETNDSFEVIKMVI